MNHNSLLTGTLMLCLCGIAAAQTPNVLQKVGFDQRLDEQIPLDLEFRDHRGNAVTLRRYFADRPVVLSLVYYECPMLCTLELNGLVRSLKALPLTMGEDFIVLTISFDPGETAELAAKKRQAYLEQYNRQGGAAGWHFLTGNEASIQALCAAVGFRYRYEDERDEYAHASGIVVLTPQGRIARYFYGIDYPAKDLRLGLVEASAGEIGSPTDQLLLLCYSYDPATGKYGLVIMSAIRLGGAVTVLALGAFVGLMLYRERRNRKTSSGRAEASESSNGGPQP